MDDQPSKLWNVALLLSLLLLAGVAYYRFAPVREVVDAKCPWIKEQLAKQGIRFTETGEIATTPAPADSSSPAASNATSPSKPGTASAPAKPMNIAQIAANRSLWPKAVKIKKTTEFPAVSNGKEIGKLNVPAGTEVKLISLTADKVGVAYSPDGAMSNAGGTWLLVAETDLLERVQIGR